MDKKYDSDEYFSVIDNKTGKKIADCGEWLDAMMILNFDPQNRIITKNQFLMDKVIDITVQKSLPTSELVINNKFHQKNELSKKNNQLNESNLKEFIVE